MDGGKPVLTPIGGGKDKPWVTRCGTVAPLPLPGLLALYKRHQPERVEHFRAVYLWLCESLIADGQAISAAGMQLTLLVESILTWADDLALCLKEGRNAISPQGNRYEFPHSYNERKGSERLKRDLPEGCLTIMSQIEARLKASKTSEAKQDDLFADLASHAANRPPAA